MSIQTIVNSFNYIFRPFVYRSAQLIVMFFDVVGFTKSSTNEDMQSCIREIELAISEKLYNDYNWNEIRRERKYPNDLILIPAGDGYAFAFHPNFTSETVLDIIKKFYCRLIKDIPLKIRMGIAKGPCQIYRDANDKNNIFGYGINLANRVMSLALDNQILVHKNLADEILQQKKYDELHEIITPLKIKHGEKLQVFNFYGRLEKQKFGNKKYPSIANEVEAIV